MKDKPEQVKQYDLRALAKFLYEHCALNPDQAGEVAATILEEYNIWPDDFTLTAPVQCAPSSRETA